MKSLYWQIVGTGNYDLVLLHGWGLNANIWSCIVTRLSPYFRLHLVDLPGYGCSQGYGALTLEQMTDEIISHAPTNALWLGWSLGGLVATQVAKQQPNAVRGLITVASSPHFCADSNWPGIRSVVLYNFAEQLREDFTRTVNRFLGLQTLGVESTQKYAHWLKNVVWSRPLPTSDTLAGGLSLLQTCDLRSVLPQLTMPLLRLYGYLDSIVPHKVVPLIDKMCPDSKSIIFTGTAHAPFVSHPDRFCQVLFEFSQNI